MTSMEKAAWTEVVVSVGAFSVVLALYPWLGDAATGAFGLLGFLVISVLFLRKRGDRVRVDERDREIERKSKELGVGSAWMFLFMALVALVLWSSAYNDRIIATGAIHWLIWIQFVICYGVKGGVAVAAYRNQRLAS